MSVSGKIPPFSISYKVQNIRFFSIGGHSTKTTPFFRCIYCPAFSDDGDNSKPQSSSLDAGKFLESDSRSSCNHSVQNDNPLEIMDDDKVAHHGSLRSYSDLYKLRHALAHGNTDATILSSSSSSSSASLSSPSASSSTAGRDSAESISLASALELAHEALSKAESSLDGIESLPSARPQNSQTEGPMNWPLLISVAKTATALALLSAALLASHGFGLIVQWTSAVVGAVAIAVWGLRRGSLSTSGAAAAAVVGLATLGCSLRFGATLLAFYFSSSKLTQYKEHVKVVLDDHAKKGGQRDWLQVREVIMHEINSNLPSYIGLLLLSYLIQCSFRCYIHVCVGILQCADPICIVRDLWRPCRLRGRPAWTTSESRVMALSSCNCSHGRFFGEVFI